MQELGSFVIKPDGFDHNEEITSIIECGGITILAIKIVTATVDIVKNIHPHGDERMLKLRIRQYQDDKYEFGRCLLGIIIGENVNSRLVSVCGEKTNPAECDPMSIRYRYGTHDPILTPENEWMYRNAIHRSKTPEKAPPFLRFFHSL